MVADGLSLLGHWHARVICMGMASVLCGLLTIYVGGGLDWWTEFVTNETLLGLDAQIPVMDVVDSRWYLCLHQGFDGIFLDGTALLTSIQTAKKRPPPEPPPAWWISPEPPPSAYGIVLLVTGRRSVILTFLVALSVLSERPSLLVGMCWLVMCLVT